MSKGLRVTLLTIGGIVAVAALLLIGMNIGRAAAYSSNAWSDGFSVFRTDLDFPYSDSMMGWPSPDFPYANYMMGAGMMGMMGEHVEPADNAELPVTPQEAVDIAQRYLEEHLPGSEAGDSSDAFYGYYTLHIERNGEVVGMLSVNGTTGQVWPHTWHGELLDLPDQE